MIIHVYALCWNEEKMIPFFFKHYDNITDQYFVFDNDSTDNSLSILNSNPKVSIDKFEIKDNSLVQSAQNQYNHFWKQSRGNADWVIICNVDEHLYHPDLRTYLQECTSKGITLIVPTGYEMVSDSFPDNNKPLHESIKYGARSLNFDKPQIFNPNAIQEINFGPGRHIASPVGNVIKPIKNEVLLLHYKYLGFEYLNSRHSELQQGLRIGDILRRWGIQYLWNENKRLEQFEKVKSNAVKVL